MLIIKKTIYQKLDNGRRVCLGVFDTKTHTLEIPRERSLHFMRKLNSWGVDLETIRNLIPEGLETVVQVEKESGVVLKIDVDTMFRVGVIKEYKPYKKQLFVKEEYWERVY